MSIRLIGPRLGLGAKSVLCVAALCATAAHAQSSSSRLPSASTRKPASASRAAAGTPLKRPPYNAEFERKKAENARKFEQRARQAKADFERESKQRREGTAKSRQAAVFHAGSAPPPEKCLAAFVAAARNATSLEEILPYLPAGQAETIKAQRANYDPQHTASARAAHRKLNPNISEEELAHLTSRPGEFELKFHRDLAREILQVLSVKTEGDKAELVVSTQNGATIDGVYYPYGKAHVEMMGEGSTWKLSRYRPSIVYYNEPPRSP